MFDEYTKLMRQAAPTVEEYMVSAVEMIDKQFGDGYAKKHPELVGAFIQAASTDYGASVISKEIEKSTETIGRIADFLDDVPIPSSRG